MKTVLSLIFLLALTALPASAEEVYRWVDDKGVTHFTAHPPRNRESTRVHTQTGHSEPVDYSHYGQDKADSQNNGGQAQKAEAQPLRDDQRCQKARQNLETLQSGGRIVETAENGERRYLDEEDQRQRAERAREVIAQSC